MPQPATAPPPPPPRAVPLSALSWNAKFMLPFGGIWCGIGFLVAIIFTLTGGPLWDDWILDANGVRAKAVCYDSRATNTTVNDRRLMEVFFRFTDRKGRKHKSSISTTDWDVLRRVGTDETLDIEYDPSNPNRVRLVGGRASFFGYYTLIPLAVGVATSPLLLLALIRLRRDRHVYRNGEPAAAQVIDVTSTGSSEGRRSVMAVHYRFLAPGAMGYTGTWKTVDAPAVGAALWVLYDPRNPNRNIAVPGSAPPAGRGGAHHTPAQPGAGSHVVN